MAHGLGSTNARSLRSDIAGFIRRSPKLNIAHTPLEDWVKWDSNGLSVQVYGQRMARGGWGGGIEMAACSNLKRVNVHVYEQSKDGFRRIAQFNRPGALKTISVLYQGGMHYDALITS